MTLAAKQILQKIGLVNPKTDQQKIPKRKYGEKQKRMGKKQNRKKKPSKTQSKGQNTRNWSLKSRRGRMG